MPSRLAHITTHFFNLPASNDEPTYGTWRQAQELTSSTTLAMGAASAHRSTGGPLDGSRLMAAMRRGGGASGGSYIYSAGATGRPSSSVSSTVALTPLLSPASPTSPVITRWPTFPVSSGSSGGGPRSCTALTKARRAVEDSNLCSPSSPVLPSAGMGTDAASIDATLPSLPTWSVDARPWPASAGAGMTGKEAAGGVAGLIGSRNTSPRISAAGQHGAPYSATVPMSPTRKSLSPSHWVSCGTAVGHDRATEGISTTASGRDGDGVGGRGGTYSTFADPATTLVTEVDSDLLMPPLMHYVEDEEVLRYVSGLLDRRRIDEVASAVEAVEHPSAEDISAPFKGLSRAVVLQGDYVLNAQQSKSLHARMMPISGSPHAMRQRCAYSSALVSSSDATRDSMKHAAADNDVGMTTPGCDRARTASRVPKLHSRGEKEAAAATMRSTNKGSANKGSATSPLAATTSSLYLTALTKPLYNTGSNGVYLSCSNSGDAAATNQSAAQQRSGRLRTSRDAVKQGGAALAAVASSASTAELQGADTASEGRTAVADAAVASALPIDLEGFCLAVRHNVFANYRTLPVYCAQRSYEQLPGRYRAGLDAISADVLQQQRRDQQQGSTGAISASDEPANVAVSTSVGGGGAVNMGHPCGRRSEGSLAGFSAAAPGAAGYAAESCHDSVTFIGMGYYGAGGRSSAWPATVNLSGSVGAASTATTPAASPGWLSRGGSMCLDTSVFPTNPSCVMEERSAATVALPASAPATSTPRGTATAGPAASPQPLSSPTSAVTTASATVGDATAGMGLGSRGALLHYIQRTVQLFIARGEREVALHFLMATAPYRFSGTTDSDRVLALFNQIRFFLPSPRFGIVMLAMDAWRSLYRPSVGAGAADCTHMTLELLALIETYLCHGRTYAECVSGLLMLRAVLALAMENSTLCTRTAAVLQQHRSLLQGRLPTFLLAVWLILMELYTIDDTVQLPRRILRDLAANAMQDLFTVALELNMTLPVQNVVANAVNVFFAGPQPQLQLGLSPLFCGLSDDAAISVEVNHRGGSEASNNSPVNANPSAAMLKPTNSLHLSAAKNADKSVDSEAMMLSLRTSDVSVPAAAGVSVQGSGAPETGTARSPSPSRPSPNIGKVALNDTANTAVPLPLHCAPGTGSTSVAASACLSQNPVKSGQSASRTIAATSASPAPKAPVSSYRAVAKTMWGSVKRAARSLVRSKSVTSSSPALTTTTPVDGCRDGTEVAGATRTAVGSVPVGRLAPPAFDLSRRMASARTMVVNRHPSPPLLLEVLEDIFRDSVEADLPEHAEAIVQSTGSVHQQAPLSTTSAAAGSRWLVQSSSSPSSHVVRRTAVTNVPAGGGRGTMLSPYHALRQPSAAGSPLLRPGSLAQRRQQQRSFSAAAAAAATQGLESSSAFSDALWGDVPFDGPVPHRDALWTLPLARALPAAGRPHTLEATVAASTLTLGAFLCAWRIAGLSDEMDSSGCVGSRVSRHPCGTTAAAANSLGASPTEASVFPSGEAPLPHHFGPASGEVATGDADPFSEGSVLPLLTPESLVAVADSGVPAGCRDALGESVSLPCPLPVTGGSTTMPPGVGTCSGAIGLSTGEPEKSVPMLSTTIAALSGRTGAPRRRGRWLVSTVTDADPEWQSVGSAATNVYVPPVAGVAPPIGAAPRAATRVEGNEVSTAPLAVATDMTSPLTVPPLPLPRAGPLLHMAQGAVAASAAAGNQCEKISAAPVTPEALSGAVVATGATPDTTFLPSLNCTSRSMQGAADLVMSATVAGSQRGLPATIPISTADVRVSANSRSEVGARGDAEGARPTMALPSPAVASRTADGRRKVAEKVPPTPSLSFFLPSWAAVRVLERCVRPCWDSTGHTALPSGAEGARAATRHTGAVTVTKEAEILLTSMVPLLSQYYVDELSASAVTAAMQVLVNRAIQSVKSLSQGLRECSSRLSANNCGGAPTERAAHACSGGTPPPSSPPPLEVDVGQCETDMGASHYGAEPPAAAPCAGAPTAISSTSCASPFSSWRAENSAQVDGTELLNAILFMTTVSAHYPAVYERMLHQRLYPLLHHILLLHTSALEEPQRCLSKPRSSAAVATNFHVGDRSAAIPPQAPQHQQPYSSHTVTTPTAMVSEADIQRMRLITARTMYQRLAMPALLLLSHNMPDEACARRCYPLVVRLAQLGLRRPFSMASVTTALCICTVYPPLSRVCQCELVRAMAVVLATPDDVLSDGDDDPAALSAATTAPREAEEGSVKLAHRPRRVPPQTRPEDERRGTREGGTIGSKPAGPTRGAAPSPRPLPMTSTTAAVSQALSRASSSRPTAAVATVNAAHPMWRSRLNLQLFFPFSRNVGHLRLPAASVRAAQRRQAAQTRLIKHHCFRAMSLFYSSWEGTTLFFLEVCLPYLWHPDAQLRLECVQCCMRWLLSDCWHSTDQTWLHHHAATPTSSEGGADAAPSKALTSFRGSVTAAVTRAPVGDPRTIANNGSNIKGGAHGAAALRCLTTRRTPALLQAEQVRLPYHVQPRQTAEVLSSGVSLAFDEGAGMVPAVPTAITRAPAMPICTLQHHGRTHVNALREVVHHLVELAVCDPEPLIRKCALESLSPETYPLLYPHEPFVHQLFTVLWDSYMPNRSRAAQLLCALAPLNPSSIFPRLHQVLVQYTEDLTKSIARLASPSLPVRSTPAPLPVAAPVHIHEDALFVLFQISSRLKQSTHLYLPKLLSIVSAVLRSGSSPRGSVLRALHFLVALREDSTEEQSALFAPFFDLVAQQLVDGDGDTARLLATVAAMQSLLQQFTGSAHSSPHTLPMVVERLHSLLYRKPSVVTEFAMAVLQLLGTISSIEPWDIEAAPRAPALLRRPQNRYALPPLSSSTGVLGRGRAARLRWLDREERADSAAEALAQLQKSDRFSPFTARAWCDTVLRALMRTVSGYVNGTMSQTQGGLCACLAAIMNILTSTVAICHLELYLPTVLTLVIDLLEKRQTRWRDIETAYPSSTRHTHSGTTAATGCGDGVAAAAGGPTKVEKINDSSEAIRQLFLRRLFDLVLAAGRRIGPMYPLLNVFLRRSWKAMSPRGLVQCCEVLDALCWAVPDLLRDDCDVWIPSLLEALIQYDALVVTHRRAHEGVRDGAPANTNTSTGASTIGKVSGVAVTPAEGEETPVAPVCTSRNLSSSANRMSPAQHGSVAADAGDNISSPLKKLHTPPQSTHSAAAVNGNEKAPWEQELKLVYQALTRCLTSLQPLVPSLAKRFVALSLSECLKSSHVPRGEAVRRTAAPTAAAAPSDSGVEQGSGFDAEHSTTLTTSLRSSAQSCWPATGPTTASAVFDLMEDPHEELISFLNACVCRPLLEYMVHSNLSTVSMKLAKNLLSRLESLSAVHDEALQRLWRAMGRRSTSLLSQPERSTSLHWMSEMASGTTGCPDGNVGSLTAPARAQLEVKLREARELLHLQRARQHEEGSGSVNVSGCGSGTFSSVTAFYAAPRSASEALWFSNAALSRMWVQSTDRAVTVRRYFPFDSVHTSWETEGEVQLLGCLLVAAAWHHPPSTNAFATTLHTYFSQRFGPDSVAVAYVRCVCSRYYDLCVPLTSVHEEEIAARWAAQQQQRVTTTASGSDLSTESVGSLTSPAQRTVMRVPGLYDTAGQITREGSADVILRHLSSPVAQTAASTAHVGRNTTASARGCAVLSGASGMGCCSVRWEEDAATLIIGGSEGTYVPSSAAATAFIGASATRATTRWAQGNSAEASLGSALATAVMAHGDSTSDMTLARSMTACPSMEHFDSSSEGRQSADMTAKMHFSDHDDDQDGSRRTCTDVRYAHQARGGDDGTVMSHRLHMGDQQPQASQLHHAQYPLPTRTATSTPFGGPNSVPRTITAHSINGGDTSPSTTPNHSPTTATMTIPVDGGVAGSLDRYVNASAPVGVPGFHSGSGSVSSLYLGSLFTGAAVAEGRVHCDGGECGGVLNDSLHRHTPHAALGVSGGGWSADVEVTYGRGSSEAMPPAHVPVGGSTGVHLTTPICRPFQLPHPQPFPAGQSHGPYSISSWASPNVILGQQTAASPSGTTGVLTGGTFTAASHDHHRSVLGLPASVFSPVGGAGGGSPGAAGGPGGMPPRWRFASIAASVTADDVASPSSSTMPPSGSGAGATLSFTVAPHDTSSVQHHPCRLLSPFAPHLPLHRPVSCGTMSPSTATMRSRGGSGNDLSGSPLQSTPVQQAQKQPSPLHFFAEASAPSIKTWAAAVGAVPSTTSTVAGPPPLRAEVYPTSAVQSQSATTQMDHGDLTAPAAGAASDKLGKEEAAETATTVMPPCAAREMLEACAAVAAAHEAGEVEHNNLLIAYFELHRSISGYGWRSWWEQFCLYLLQCSPDYCIQACEPFAREHHIAFSYSELLPLALLSTLPSCTVVELVAWLRALRDFYTFHTDPSAPVPQQIASGVARIAHDIRLYHRTFFPPEVVSRVVDVWLPESVVAELAHRSLNPPLRILYLEQDLTRFFSWGCTALLMVSADDVASALERTLFVQHPQFQQWLSAAAATTSGMRGRSRAVARSPGQRGRNGNSVVRSSAAAVKSSSSTIDTLPPSALELLGFHRAAALEYVRLYEEQQMSECCDSRRSAAAEEDETSERRAGHTSKDLATRHHSSAAAARLIVGAMRCYICLCDFEAVLQLWEAIKGRGTADTTTSMVSSPPSADTCREAPDDDSGSAVVSEGCRRDGSCLLGPETARYVVMSAQALSRWEYVQEAAYYAFGRGSAGVRSWTTSAPQAAQAQASNSGGLAANSVMKPHAHRSQQSLESRQSGEDVGEEGRSQPSLEDVFSSDLPFASGGTVELRESDHTRDSLLQRQMEVFVGAALVASHDYDGARRALTAVRDGLRDSYAIFHSDNERVKLEWSSIFQQLSDLEEGMHALEQVPATQEGMATVSTSTESGGTAPTWSGARLPALDREVNGKLFPDVTARRLRNITCRPVSATTTILQLFMIIAVRSAIAPVTWQLDNVLALGERLEKAGQPMRAVQALHHYANLPAVATSFTETALGFKQQLHLEMLRRLIRNLSGEEDLREVHASVQTALRNNLWLAHRATVRRISVAAPSASFSASLPAVGASSSLPQQNPLAMDCAAPRGPVLTAQELGPSLSHYQVELLLLNVACRRRLAHVLRHRALLAHRPSPPTVPLPTSDAPAPLTDATGSDTAPSSTLDTGRHPMNMLALSMGTDRTLCRAATDAVEAEKAFDTDLHSPTRWPIPHPPSDFPATAASPLSTGGGGGSAAAAAAERRCTGDSASYRQDAKEGRCVGKSGTSPAWETRAKTKAAATTTRGESVEAKEEGIFSPESVTGSTAMFAEYFLLEQAVAITCYVPSVWREFGLVLFDVCMAIHAEWRFTEDEETKQNFLTQSAKAIHGLQLAAQLWRNQSESVFSRGIGPFPATMMRRHSHARTALPSAHLLLKALHLAVTCETIVQDDARATTGSAPETAAAAAEAAVMAPSLSLPLSASSSAPQFSLEAHSETAKDAEEVEVASGTSDGHRTCSVLTTQGSVSATQRTVRPRAVGCEAETSEGDETEKSRVPAAMEKTTDATVPPRPPSASQPQPAVAAAVTEQQGGFSCLDFSAASYVQWAAIAPFLLATATRHHNLYVALRDMCVQSRDMLRQLVFPLMAMLEHEHGIVPAQQDGHPRHRRASIVEEAPSSRASRHLTSTFVAMGGEGQEDERAQQRRGFDSSTRMLEDEDGNEQVVGVGYSNSTEAPSLLEHEGVAERDASDAGLIAKCAARTLAREVRDRRHKGVCAASRTALATPLLSTRAGTSDGETARMGGSAVSHTVPSPHCFVSPLERPLEEADRSVYSSLLADIAAASHGHRRLIQEAMQMRSFVKGLWEGSTAASRGRNSLGAATRQYGMDSSLASSGPVEGAPPPMQRVREAVGSGATPQGTTSGQGGSWGFVATDDVSGMHGEMELLLDGFCPLPAPLWLLPSVFGVGMTAGDTSGSSAHDNTGGDEGARGETAHTGGVGAGPEATARGRPHGGQSACLASSATTAPATRTAGYRGARAGDGSGDVAGLPRPSAAGLPASTAAPHSQPASHSTATSAVRFAPATVPAIMHVRRYAVPNPAPHHHCEEVIFVMLSDGLVCRFRHAAPAPTTRSGEFLDTSELPHGATDSVSVRVCQSRKSGATSTGTGAKDAPISTGDSGADLYVLPCALMEQIASLLLCHLPLTHLQRPFVLPLTVRDYMTMLPEHRTSPLILGAATAASVRLDDPQGWRHDMALLTGPASGTSAAALRTARQLLAWSSEATRTPPSLYHLMDDYTVHLRTREMALAAQEAVEAYPTLDLDAVQIAAETGRRLGVSADNAYPFNWAYGYSVSAPPTEEAAAALTNSHRYRDLVQQRRMNEERFDQLVAAAYDDGCVGPLIAFLQGMLAARPSSPPSSSTPAAVFVNPTSTMTETTASFSDSSSAPAPQPLRSPEEVFWMQQRLYAYAAVLPRTEAHLRSVLAALSAVVTDGGETTKESSAPSPSSPLSPAVPPALHTRKRHFGYRQTFTAAQAAPVTGGELQACRLVLFRLESARCRLALNEAFSADSSNASHWLEARRTYAKELSEWSVIEYLLDIHTRECGTVLVNTYDGHVSVHALGRYCLQPSPQQSRHVCAKEAATYAADVVPFIESPFPTHDATLFRLTPVLVAGLPLQSAHSAFQFHAGSVLYEIFQYARDLTGIATYGVDCVTVFTHAAAATGVGSSPLSHTLTETPLSACRSSDFSAGESGDSGATLRPEGNRACASERVNTAAADESAAGPRAAASSRRTCTRATAAQTEKKYEATPVLESLVSVPAAAAPTPPSSAVSALLGHEAAQRHADSLLDDAAHTLTLPPSPRCFDSSSLRLKLSYDALLFLHEEAERSGRATMLRLLRNQREATEAQWLHATPTSLSENKDEGNAVEEQVPATSHEATEAKMGRTVPPPLRDVAIDDDEGDGSAPRLTSAFDLVAAMIKAATDEENLLGVDNVCPHTWRRWAPHW
ncbi:hypothetical protein, conserved [Leishmania tarentolae]|uniref:Uncharacterized protein n=1 Tax=Leishmania tarentolae TaxID=5689 RepID=A0A640KED9_LEITA|nr:hypothetical protein, conserved [Leishmania tarentolae]